MFKFFSKSKSKEHKEALNNSSNKITGAFTKIFTHKKLDDNTLDELEEILLISDIGSKTTLDIIENLRKEKFGKNVGISEVKEFLSNKIVEILEPCEKKLNLEEENLPKVIIFNGVNGSGKTTTIGKIAQNLKNQNKKVLIAACDTFRAAAAEQLEVWANRSNSKIIMPNKEGEDPAAVAYRALSYAKENHFDILLIDTAGRLQNKQNLMDELGKISRVLKKLDEKAPHENLLVLDSTVGQNAKSQMEIFNDVIGITGIIVTKLDGSAKGGIIIALAKEFQKPIYAIGIGEKLEDLQEFNAENFSKNLLGL
jgi:fused signal recognition particle receptor